MPHGGLAAGRAREVGAEPRARRADRHPRTRRDPRGVSARGSQRRRRAARAGRVVSPAGLVRATRRRGLGVRAGRRSPRRRRAPGDRGDRHADRRRPLRRRRDVSGTDRGGTRRERRRGVVVVGRGDGGRPSADRDAHAPGVRHRALPAGAARARLLDGPHDLRLADGARGAAGGRRDRPVQHVLDAVDLRVPRRGRQAIGHDPAVHGEGSRDAPVGRAVRHDAGFLPDPRSDGCGRVQP